jgi:AraC family transcriptional regulator, regulatory protein of adaptative response / methylated-DNA-[protein]-cysteine methyltransferase
MGMDRNEMITAFMDRDATYDGLFYAGITTTGIFCRPSCPARKALPKNVEFYAGAKEALFAGFRPCGRCRPLETGESVPDWAKKLMREIEDDPSRRIKDADLRAAGLNPTAVRRYFLKRYEMTFQAYCRSRRLGAAFSAIRSGKNLDDAILGFGWDSHSGFREAFSKAAGMPPGAARTADRIRLARIETPLGTMVAGASDEALLLLEFTDRRMLEKQFAVVGRRFRLPAFPEECPLFTELRKQLGEYFAGARKSFDLPLAYPGTEFQVRVWDALRGIPFGETRSYGALAAEIGSPEAGRAVGRANGLNRIAILIPCHRVIDASGGLGGYGGGLWRKLRLLENEGKRFSRQ